MAQRPRTPVQSFVFIVGFFVAVAALLFAASFELPNEARALGYMLMWIVVVAGAIRAAEAIVDTARTKA
jgi:hypothetical protein